MVCQQTAEIGCIGYEQWPKYGAKLKQDKNAYEYHGGLRNHDL